MFASFHHFEPRDAEQILKSAFNNRSPIGIFEVTARTPAGIICAFLIPPRSPAHDTANTSVDGVGVNRTDLPDPNSAADDFLGRTRLAVEDVLSV